MSRKAIMCLNTALIVLFTVLLLAYNSWSNYNKELEARLQVNKSKQEQLEQEIKMLQADNQAKDKQINELESKPQ